eukprot:gene5225-18455_t
MRRTPATLTLLHPLTHPFLNLCAFIPHPSSLIHEKDAESISSHVPAVAPDVEPCALGNWTDTASGDTDMESSEGSEDRESHGHAANAQQQFPVMMNELPINKAASSLGIGVSVLMEHCCQDAMNELPINKAASSLGNGVSVLMKHCCQDAVYGLPINEAASSLGIGVTVLKKYCRQYAVGRWPFRKLTSIDKLMQLIEDDMQEDPEASLVSY